MGASAFRSAAARRHVLLAGFAATLAAAASVGSSASSLPSLFDSAKSRALGAPSGAAPGLCSTATSDGRPNFFLLWPLHPQHFGQQAYGTLESVLFHHPAANVVVVSAGLDESTFATYLLEGYCVASLALELPQLQTLLSAALDGSGAGGAGGAGLASTFISSVGVPQTEEALLLLLNAALMALQVLNGGTSLSMDGILLNPFDWMLPAGLSLQRTGVFLERLLDPEASHPWALEAEDFERSWLPRSHTDRGDNRTALCLDALCPRSLPKGSGFGRILLQGLLEEALPGKGDGLDMSQRATVLYRLYVRQRPQPTPFQVEGWTFEHEMAVLPYWALADSHFADGWKDFGGTDSEAEAYSQLFQPRPLRAPADWSLVSSAKLWLSLGSGPASARNVMPRSVVDLALRHFSLGLMPRPYLSKAFGRRPKPVLGRRLHGPADAISEFTGIADAIGPKAPMEAALPGFVGGFRTFRQLRLVGRDSSSAQSGEALPWRVAISSTTPGLKLFCRREQRSTTSVGAAALGFGSEGSAAFRSCEAALRPGSSEKKEGGALLFEVCGKAGEVNAAVTLLAYAPTLAVGDWSNSKVVTGRDFRLGEEELQSHFGVLRISAHAGCGSASELGGGREAEQVLELSALLDDVETQVTVVAHCAERCHLLDRLAVSFREVYARIPIIATCECAEEEAGCLEPTARPHASVPGMTVVSVPYDFGLSRGKTLLVEMANSEFVLVLDDDFVHSSHSCLECMLCRMRSQRHSLWRPFDILGFPVQEDERLFGAFRGSLRVASHQLFLEPLVEESTPDGCIRVDICPMVFLARTDRLRTFEFSKDLKVGEHEQFFYSNAYNGAQVAVCFDSSFPHFRVNTMSASYVKRRERMPELMLSAFKKLGFERAMFLFRKYDHGRMSDYDELLDKVVPPWFISHDTCGRRASPPVSFSQVLAVVLSSGDAVGERYRQVLRGQTDAAGIWLQRFTQAAGVGTLRWVFAVTTDEQAYSTVALNQERDRYQDLVLLSPRQSKRLSESDFDTKQLLEALALLREFQFRWLLVARQDVFVHPERLLEVLQNNDRPDGKVLGSWKQETASDWRLNPQLFMMPRDVFALISAPEVASRLASTGQDAIFGDLSELGSGLSAWMRAFRVERAHLPDIHVGIGAAGFACPRNTLALHPVSPEELYELSREPGSPRC